MSSILSKLHLIPLRISVFVIRKQLEIDFVCNKGSKRYYVQSAYAIPDQEKMKQEQRSLMLTGDFFKKNHHHERHSYTVLQ